MGRKERRATKKRSKRLNFLGKFYENFNNNIIQSNRQSAQSRRYFNHIGNLTALHGNNSRRNRILTTNNPMHHLISEFLGPRTPPVRMMGLQNLNRPRRGYSHDINFRPMQNEVMEQMNPKHRSNQRQLNETVEEEIENEDMMNEDIVRSSMHAAGGGKTSM